MIEQAKDACKTWFDYALETFHIHEMGWLTEYSVLNAVHSTGFRTSLHKTVDMNPTIRVYLKLNN